MRQNLTPNHRVPDAGDDPHRTAAGLTDLNIDPEYALEALRPGHGEPAGSRRALLHLIRRLASGAPAPTRLRHQGPVWTVRRNTP